MSMERMDALLKLMSDQGLDALLLRHIPDIRWLTGFTGVFDEEEAHTVLVSPGIARIYSDGRYSQALEERASDSCWEVVLGSGPDVSDFKRVGIQDDISLREYRKLSNSIPAHCELVETEDLLLGLRSVKDAHEVACLEEAGRITDEAFDWICGRIAVGMSERELAYLLDCRMHELGSQAPSFPTIVCAGANAAMPHHIPDDTLIEQGDLVLFDFGACFQDYHADMTRVISMGKPNALQREVYELVRRANEIAEDALRPGMSGAEVHAVAADVIAAGGYGSSFTHGLGHGLGLQIHESPNLSPRNPLPLPLGAAVTVEPGIYLPGVLGVRLEDFGILEEAGFRSLSHTGHDLPII